MSHKEKKKLTIHEFDNTYYNHEKGKKTEHRIRLQSAYQLLNQSMFFPWTLGIAKSL